ncbi:hypothetical protein [Nostoc sp.]|uniref:hypothetical protein n=1 Tax=Nostoc sp. TaxID=1180 RepID=UPI002FF6967D
MLLQTDFFLLQTDFFCDGATTKGDKPNGIATLTAQKDGWGRVRIDSDDHLSQVKVVISSPVNHL